MLCMSGTFTQEQLGYRCTLVIEEEAELRVHLQSGESGLLSMDDSHGGFNSKLLDKAWWISRSQLQS